MEVNELKATWEKLDKALERGNRLGAEILRRQRVDATQQSLRPLRRQQTFQILFGAFFIVLAALLWATKPVAVSLILSGVTVQAYGIGCILTAGLVLSSLNHIDYAGPVVNVQTGLAKLRRAYGIAVLVAGLSWWFLWIPLLMLLLGLAHINLYANAPSVIWIGITIGVAGLAAMYWLYVYAMRSENLRLRRFVEQATFGRSLMAALEQIEEVRNFEKEMAGADL
jgi:hypothetical protein